MKRITSLIAALAVAVVKAPARSLCAVKWHPFRKSEGPNLSRCRVCGRFVAQEGN